MLTLRRGEAKYKFCRYGNCCMCWEPEGHTKATLPPEVLLSGQQHLMPTGLSSGAMSATSSCYAIVYCCYGCSGLCTGMGLSGGLGDWAGMRTSWLRHEPAKTEIPREVQKAGGGGEHRKDKPAPALPPSSTALYTQIELRAQRSCYRQSWYYTRATSKSLFSSSVLGKERVTSYFRCGFLTFTIFWSPQERATVMTLLARVLKITQKLKRNQTHRAA